MFRVFFVPQIKLLSWPNSLSRLETSLNGLKNDINKQKVNFSTSEEHLIKPQMHTVWDCRQYKGLEFTFEERQVFGILGLIPPCYRTHEEQLFGVKSNFDGYGTPLDKYMYLIALRSKHEKLFFGFLNKYIDICLPIVYTPTIGLACLHFGLIYHSPYGIYLTKHDRNRITDVLANWRRKEVTAICVTDGERILGLGDLGASGMGITISKLQLYTALGHIDPGGLLPVVVDVGTGNKNLLNDPFYIGLREERMRGQEYDDYFEEFMKSISDLYGSRCFVHFEDFALPNALKLLKKYQNKYCCYNDDLQGAGAVGVGGILAACRALKNDLKDHTFLFVGTGCASMGISTLLVEMMITMNISRKDAYSKIFLYDLDGLVTSDRSNMSEILLAFAKDLEPMDKLHEAIALIKPTIIFGATGAPKIFSETVLREVAKHHKRPVIFAFANLTSKAECTAEEAYRYTEGRAIFSSGSPFPPVVWEDKTHVPGQANTSLIFPGIALGVMSSKARHVPDEVYLIASKTLASFNSDELLEKGCLYPPIKLASKLAFEIGVAVASYIFENDLSQVYPKPEDICRFIHMNLYTYESGSSIPQPWKYPPSKKLE